eukprot:scaffold41005_cov41-Cyclotella_meneghiniana.AAC.1
MAIFVQKTHSTLKYGEGTRSIVVRRVMVDGNKRPRRRFVMWYVIVLICVVCSDGCCALNGRRHDAGVWGPVGRISALRLGR